MRTFLRKKKWIATTIAMRLASITIRFRSTKSRVITLERDLETFRTRQPSIPSRWRTPVEIIQYLPSGVSMLIWSGSGRSNSL